MYFVLVISQVEFRVVVRVNMSVIGVRCQYECGESKVVMGIGSTTITRPRLCFSWLRSMSSPARFSPLPQAWLFRRDRKRLDWLIIHCLIKRDTIPSLYRWADLTLKKP